MKRNYKIILGLYLKLDTFYEHACIKIKKYYNINKKLTESLVMTKCTSIPNSHFCISQ